MYPPNTRAEAPIQYANFWQIQSPERGSPLQQCRERHCGFTLIELLFAVLVMAVLAAQAVPAMGNLVALARLKSATNDFYFDLSLAHSEAIKRNFRVAMCPSPDGGECQPGSGWETGWMIFQDDNNSGTRDADEEIIKVTVVSKPRVAIRGNKNVMRYVSFTALGTTNLISGAFQAGTFTVCLQGRRELESRQVVINSMGRSRIAKTSAALCS